MKQPKPIYQGALYAVIKAGSAYKTVLASDFTKVQFSGARDWAIQWAQENDIKEAA
jgi:hypothetical protein